MARYKLLSFFIRGKPVQRWYDFKIHRFVKAPKMYRLSFALNYVPIHNKYRSFLFQVWSSDKEWLEANRDIFFHDFIDRVGENLESYAYAQELVVLGIEDIREVEYNESLEGEEYFDVEYH